MSEKSHRTSSLKQALAVTLVTSMVLTMPGTSGWADNSTSTNPNARHNQNRNQPPGVVVQPNGLNPSQSYVPLIRRTTLQNVSQTEQLIGALLNAAATLTGLNQQSIASKGMVGVQAAAAQTAHVVQATNSPLQNNDVVTANSPAAAAVSHAEALLKEVASPTPKLPPGASDGIAKLKEAPPSIEETLKKLTEGTADSPGDVRKKVVENFKNLGEQYSDLYVQLTTQWYLLDDQKKLHGKIISDQVKMVLQADRELAQARSEMRTAQIGAGASMGRSTFNVQSKIDAALKKRADAQKLIDESTRIILREIDPKIKAYEEKRKLATDVFLGLNKIGMPGYTAVAQKELDQKAFAEFQKLKTNITQKGLDATEGANPELGNLAKNGHPYSRLTANVLLAASAIAARMGFSRFGADPDAKRVASNDAIVLATTSRSTDIQLLETYLKRAESGYYSETPLLEGSRRGTALIYGKALNTAYHVADTAIKRITKYRDLLKDVNLGVPGARQELRRIAREWEGDDFLVDNIFLSSKDFAAMAALNEYARYAGTSNALSRDTFVLAQSRARAAFELDVTRAIRAARTFDIPEINAILNAPANKPQDLNDAILRTVWTMAGKGDSAALALAREHNLPIFNRDSGRVMSAAELPKIFERQAPSSPGRLGELTEAAKQNRRVFTYDQYVTGWNNSYGYLVEKNPYSAAVHAWHAGFDNNEGAINKIGAGAWGALQGGVGSLFEVVTSPVHVAAGAVSLGIGRAFGGTEIGDNLRFFGAAQIGNNILARLTSGTSGMQMVQREFGFTPGDSDGFFLPQFNGAGAVTFNTRPGSTDTSIRHLNSMLGSYYAHQSQITGQYVTEAGSLLGMADLRTGMASMAAEGYISGQFSKVAVGIGVSAAQTVAEIATFGGLNNVLNAGLKSLGTANSMGAALAPTLRFALVQAPAMQFGFSVADGLKQLGSGIHAYSIGDRTFAAHAFGDASINLAGTLLGAGTYAGLHAPAATYKFLGDSPAAARVVGFARGFAFDNVKLLAQGAAINVGGAAFGNLGSITMAIGGHAVPSLITRSGEMTARNFESLRQTLLNPQNDLRLHELAASRLSNAELKALSEGQSVDVSPNSFFRDVFNSIRGAEPFRLDANSDLGLRETAAKLLQARENGSAVDRATNRNNALSDSFFKNPISELAQMRNAADKALDAVRSDPTSETFRKNYEESLQRLRNALETAPVVDQILSFNNGNRLADVVASSLGASQMASNAQKELQKISNEAAAHELIFATEKSLADFAAKPNTDPLVILEAQANRRAAEAQLAASRLGANHPEAIAAQKSAQSLASELASRVAEKNLADATTRVEKTAELVSSLDNLSKNIERLQAPDGIEAQSAAWRTAQAQVRAEEVVRISNNEAPLRPAELQQRASQLANQIVAEGAAPINHSDIVAESQRVEAKAKSQADFAESKLDAAKSQQELLNAKSPAEKAVIAARIEHADLGGKLASAQISVQGHELALAEAVTKASKNVNAPEVQAAAVQLELSRAQATQLEARVAATDPAASAFARFKAGFEVSAAEQKLTSASQKVQALHEQVDALKVLAQETVRNQTIGEKVQGIEALKTEQPSYATPETAARAEILLREAEVLHETGKPLFETEAKRSQAIVERTREIADQRADRDNQAVVSSEMRPAEVEARVSAIAKASKANLDAAHSFAEARVLEAKKIAASAGESVVARAIDGITNGMRRALTAGALLTRFASGTAEAAPLAAVPLVAVESSALKRPSFTIRDAVRLERARAESNILQAHIDMAAARGDVAGTEVLLGRVRLESANQELGRLKSEQKALAKDLKAGGKVVVDGYEVSNETGRQILATQKQQIKLGNVAVKSGSVDALNRFRARTEALDRIQGMQSARERAAQSADVLDRSYADFLGHEIQAARGDAGFSAQASRAAEAKFKAEVKALAAERAEQIKEASENQPLYLLEKPGPVLEALFGTRTPSEAQAIAYAELVLSSIPKRNGFLPDQIRMLVQNLHNNIGVNAMGAGKTYILSAVMGVKSLMNTNLEGHMVVASAQEVKKYTQESSSQYPLFMRAMGIKVVNGDVAYNTGKDSGFKELSDILSAEGNKVVVFSLDTYGHLARARKEGGADAAALRKAWNRVTDIGVDEADVGALLRKSFNVGAPIEATRELKQSVFDLHQALTRLHVEYRSPSEVSQAMNDSNVFAYTKTSEGIVYTNAVHNALVGENASLRLGGRVYTDANVAEVLRAVVDVRSNEVTVQDGNAHKSSVAEGFQANTKDHSAFYEVAVHAAVKANEVGGNRTGLHALNSEFVNGKIDLTSHGSEATVSETFTRVGGKKINVFGGSGTFAGAEAIGMTIYGVDAVVDINPARFQDFSYSPRRMATVTDAQGRQSSVVVTGDGITRSVGDFVVQRIRQADVRGRGFLSIYDGMGSLRESLQVYFQAKGRLRGVSEAEINAMFEKTASMDRIVQRELANEEAQGGDSLMDLALKHENPAIKAIAKRVVVMDPFTRSEVRDELAEKVFEEKSNVFAVEMAGRALNFANRVDLVVVGAEKFSEGSLLQILGRTGRSGNEASPDGRFATTREVLVNFENLGDNARSFERLQNYVNDRPELSALRSDLSRISRVRESEVGSINFADFANRTPISPEMMRAALEANAMFRLYQDRSGAVKFRLSSEVVTKLAKEPLGIFSSLDGLSAGDRAILSKVSTKLQENGFNTSRNMYRENDFRSPQEVAKELFRNGLQQAEGVWRELANSGLRPDLAAEASRRLLDIQKTSARVDDIFASAPDRSANAPKSFASIDPVEANLAGKVAQVARSLSDKILPTESTTVSMTDTRVVSVARAAATRIAERGEKAVSNAELRQISGLAQRAILMNSSLQTSNPLIAQLAMTSDPQILRGVIASLTPAVKLLGATDKKSDIIPSVLPRIAYSAPVVNFRSAQDMGSGFLRSVGYAVSGFAPSKLDVQRQISLTAQMRIVLPNSDVPKQALLQHRLSNPSAIVDTLTASNITNIAKTAATQAMARGESKQAAEAAQASASEALVKERQLAKIAPQGEIEEGKGYSIRQTLRSGRPVIGVKIDEATNEAGLRAISLIHYAKQTDAELNIVLPRKADGAWSDALTQAASEAHSGKALIFVGQAGADLKQVSGKRGDSQTIDISTGKAVQAAPRISVRPLAAVTAKVSKIWGTKAVDVLALQDVLAARRRVESMRQRVATMPESEVDEVKDYFSEQEAELKGRLLDLQVQAPLIVEAASRNLTRLEMTPELSALLNQVKDAASPADIEVALKAYEQAHVDQALATTKVEGASANAVVLHDDVKSMADAAAADMQKVTQLAKAAGIPVASLAAEGPSATAYRTKIEGVLAARFEATKPMPRKAKAAARDALKRLDATLTQSLDQAAENLDKAIRAQVVRAGAEGQPVVVVIPETFDQASASVVRTAATEASATVLDHEAYVRFTAGKTEAEQKGQLNAATLLPQALQSRTGYASRADLKKLALPAAVAVLATNLIPFGDMLAPMLVSVVAQIKGKAAQGKAKVNLFTVMASENRFITNRWIQYGALTALTVGFVVIAGAPTGVVASALALTKIQGLSMLLGLLPAFLKAQAILRVLDFGMGAVAFTRPAKLVATPASAEETLTPASSAILSKISDSRWVRGAAAAGMGIMLLPNLLNAMPMAQTSSVLPTVISWLNSPLVLLAVAGSIYYWISNRPDESQFRENQKSLLFAA